VTTTLILANSVDGYVHTAAGVWDDAINGAAATAVNGGNELVYGADTGYQAFQAFISFTYARPTNEVETGVAIGVRHSQHHGGFSRELRFYSHDWGASVDAADWVNPLALLSKTMVAVVMQVEGSGTSQYSWAGSDELTDIVRDGGSTTYRFVGLTDRQSIYGLNPGTDEWSAFWSSETSLDPTMVVSTLPRSTLYEVLGAQVQLSDGTWAVLESDGSTGPTISLRHVNTAGTATTKATIPIGTTASTFVAGTAGGALSTGAQQLALIRDDSDNLYVIGRQGGTTNNVAVKAYTKGVGYTWTAQTLVGGALPGSNMDPTNFAAAWHSVGGGTIAVLISRCTSDGYRGTNSEMSWAILAANAALAGMGTLIRASSIAVGTFVPTISTAQWITHTNDTGTGLDVCALSSTKGVVHTWSRRNRLGALQPTTKARYILNSSGTGFDSVFYDVPETSAGTWGVKTASGKLRVIPVDSDTCVVVSADSDSLWGLTVAVIRNSGTSSSWTLLGRVRLGNESLATMPSAATLAESAAWDATLVTGPQKVWVYYFDTANGRRLMRTGVSLQSYTATREEVEVNAAVGASGSTNHAIRVARGTATPRRNLITVANRTSGGTLSTVYIVDTPNEAPTAPTLATRANFDAGTAATFNWTFNDPDVGDTQTAFELDINTSVGVDVYDTGQLSGTISYVGAGAASAASNASLTPALPSSWQPGDLLLVAASIRNTGTGTVNTPTGWARLNTGPSGNLALMGRIARTGDTAPTVTFNGGVANATTIAQTAAFRGTDQDINTVVTASSTVSFVAAGPVPWAGLTMPATNNVGIRLAWKQDDWTSVNNEAGFTEIGEPSSTLGDDAGMVWDWQTGTLGWFGGSFTVVGGANAVSQGLSVAIRPHQAPTAGSFTLPASTISNAVAYQWRVRTWDQASASGAWSSYGTFSTGVGGTVTVTDPVADNPANVITSTYTVAWSLTGATQASYRVVVKRTDTEAEVYNSGWVTSASTTAGITSMVSDVEHRIEVTTRTAGLVESNTGTRLITPSYATPDTPSITVTATPDDGHTLVSVTNPAATGDKPDVDYNQIQRRALTGDNAGEAWVTVGAVDPNGQWQDYTAASMVTYEYRVLATAADGNTEDSDTVEETLTLQGVWIHDPVDPADVTAANYAYGGGGKGDTVEATAEGVHYAGRALPVFEFGEHETEAVDVDVQVPFGADWAAQLAALTALARTRTVQCVRDARGRRVFGVITRVNRSDRRWGTDVTFAVARADYDETYTGTP
jgi:hypothetical protein